MHILYTSLCSDTSSLFLSRLDDCDDAKYLSKVVQYLTV